MEFEMETELLPAPTGRPHNWRKHIVTLACTAVTCIFLIMIYVKLESANIEENRAGCQTGLRGLDGHEGQDGAPWAEGHPGELGMHSSTELKANSGSGPAGLLSEVETLTAGIQNFTSSKGIVEGIIAGTSDGVVIISLDSLQQRSISSSFTPGVAFNWQTRKVYWIETTVGIKIADLDGSHAELLISDESYLSGLALDQITGNIYYGVEYSNARIRVCDSVGKKCATIVSGVNHVGKDIWDIDLSPSEGLMFWFSPPWEDNSVTRANMDGTNPTTIISEDIYGIYLDEFNEKLYWANGKSIGHTDLNGSDFNVLLKPKVHPRDIAVDGDTVYFTGDVMFDGHSINRHSSHIYSVRSNREVFSIANTTGRVDHITLFGRNKVSSRPNPCSNSPCANLCVLTRLSYTCL